MAKEFVSPKIEMQIDWGPVSSPSFFGQLHNAVGVVFLTCSPKPVVVSIESGKCLVPRTVFPVDDCGRVAASMVIKIGMQGNSPNPVTAEIVSASVHALAKPVTFMSTIVVPLQEICVDQKVIERTSKSMEIPDIQFKVKMVTQYMPTPEQINLVQSLTLGNRVSLPDIAERLQTASQNRIAKIMTFLESRVGKQNAEECKNGLVCCPEESWNSMGAMDPAQMNELNIQYTKVLRDRYMVPLVAAAQQTLCGLTNESQCGLSELATKLCETKEGREKVRSLMQNHLEEWVACNSCYTYDAGLDAFSMSPDAEELNGLLSKLAYCNQGVGNHLSSKKHAKKHRCRCNNCTGQLGIGLCLDGIVNKSGESQDLAGLINVGTMYMRDKTMSVVRKNLMLNKTKLETDRVNAALRETYRIQNANLMLGDCEDMAFAMTAVMQAPKMYNTEEEFDVDIDKTLNVVLALDTPSHAAIKTVLKGYRTVCLEMRPEEFISTSLVFDRGANLQDQTLIVKSEDTPKTIQALKTDFQTSKQKGMAGHAVCTNFSIKPPVMVDGVSLTEIEKWQTREGTADTILLPCSSLEKMHLSFVSTDPELQKFSGNEINSCAGHNVMGKYLARKASETCLAQFPSSRLFFNPQQACDPIDNKSSFYRYSIAFGSFFTVTHEDGLDGLLGNSRHIGLLESIPRCNKEGKMLSCASMVLGQQRQQCKASGPTASPIGISVPISTEERNYLHMVAFCHRALYVTHDDLLRSAKETGFYLMPTKLAGHCVQGVKCNSFVAATIGDAATELQARAQIAQSTGADAVRHLNSHTFSLTWKI